MPLFSGEVLCSTASLQVGFEPYILDPGEEPFRARRDPRTGAPLGPAFRAQFGDAADVAAAAADKEGAGAGGAPPAGAAPAAVAPIGEAALKREFERRLAGTAAAPSASPLFPPS
jgi:hypothetical protein